VTNLWKHLWRTVNLDKQGQGERDLLSETSALCNNAAECFLLSNPGDYLAR
jgi:hypothetical protein